uniref:Glycosylphosphatidylinositol anchor attachment 1 protein n=1 Tax=Aceria tosichella TaxID=561515 RepID=A0A6G1S8E2_9ACAR
MMAADKDHHNSTTTTTHEGTTTTSPSATTPDDPHESGSGKPGANVSTSTKIILFLTYFLLYFAGLGAFLIIIAEPFAMHTYISDNSLLVGVVQKEFSLKTEADIYADILQNLTKNEIQTRADDNNQLQRNSLATLPSVTRFLENELDYFGLEVHEQHFSYMDNGKQFNGTNVYSIIRGERSTNSESIALCVPFIKDSNRDTLSGVALTLALTKYFSSKSYWAKDVIILLVDRGEYGLSAWLDSYYDVSFRQDMKKMSHSNKNGFYYDSLPDRSGPMQAAIVLEVEGKRSTRANIKIHGMYGQLPNLDLYNMAIDLTIREGITPYFLNKSFTYGLTEYEIYQQHLETAISFVQTQASMKADGLHGLFLRYAIQSLTIHIPKHEDKSNTGGHVLFFDLLNVGRSIEAVFRSLNNLSGRFHRSYYFYIVVALRRFTSIAYYMSAFGLLVAPVLIKAYILHGWNSGASIFIGWRASILLAAALVLSVLSTFNISTALLGSIVLVPILIMI